MKNKNDIRFDDSSITLEYLYKIVDTITEIKNYVVTHTKSGSDIVIIMLCNELLNIVKYLNLDTDKAELAIKKENLIQENLKLREKLTKILKIINDELI